MAHIRIYDLSDKEKERKERDVVQKEDGLRTFGRTVPGNCLLPKEYEMYKEAIFNFDVRCEDTFVVTWPKNGTTWCLELLWCLQNDVDLETAKKIPLSKRCPFLDGSFLYQGMKFENAPTMFKDILGKIKSAESPRIIKSHLPFELLPVDLLDKAKVFICLRNPKDVLVSYYHHVKLFRTSRYDGDFAAYFDLFVDDLVIYSSYWKFTLAAWELRNHPNVCLLFYEDMKNDLESCVKKAAQFMGKELSNEEIVKIVKHLDFENMKDNSSVNMEDLRDSLFRDGNGKFIRKGQIGDWKNYFTDEMNERLDLAIEKHFKDSGLSFIYE